MANLHNSYTVFGFTSPRTFEKAIPEIALLIEKFDGSKWDTSSQIAFFDALFAADFYEGDVRPTEPDFAARDRMTRAPKALGFIDLKPTIALTPAGARLLSGQRVHETLTRQLMKFQLPSPFHTADAEGRFGVKPYLELLRLTHDLYGISKREIAMFFLQLTRVDKYDAVKQKILDFRAASKAHKGNRRAFAEAVFDQQVAEIFAQQIEQKHFATRQSSEATFKKFTATKKSSMRDYADAFMRYLRATQLATFDARSTRLRISQFKKQEVEFLLQTIKRKPRDFKDTAEFKTYLFDADNVALYTDDLARIQQSIQSLQALGVATSSGKAPANASLEQLKDYLEALQAALKARNLGEIKRKLKSHQDLPEILEVFEQIKQKEIPDAPLYLEWNVWRALTMLNYAVSINGNFSTDLDGQPLSTAGGNQADIECEYDGFKLLVEVTLSSGNKQYEMEGEPVARHFGNVKRNSQKPVYCLFIAPNLSEGAKSHFFNLNKMHTKFYGGKTQIIPLSLENFIGFARLGVEKNFSDANRLQQFLQKSIEANEKCADEEVWVGQIQSLAQTWLP